MSQGEVAEKLGYSSPQFVSNWERGLACPPLDALSVLIKLYNLNREELIEKILEQTRKELESSLKKKQR